MWVPTERTLGISQRIFYVHVPIGWVGMVSIVVVGVASVVHLITRNNFWDAIAYSAAELGIIFATLILLTARLGCRLGSLVDLGSKISNYSNLMVHLCRLFNGKDIFSRTYRAHVCFCKLIRSN